MQIKTVHNIWSSWHKRREASSLDHFIAQPCVIYPFATAKPGTWTCWNEQEPRLADQLQEGCQSPRSWGGAVPACQCWFRPWKQGVHSQWLKLIIWVPKCTESQQTVWLHRAGVWHASATAPLVVLWMAIAIMSRKITSHWPAMATSSTELRLRSEKESTPRMNSKPPLVFTMSSHGETATEVTVTQSADSAHGSLLTEPASGPQTAWADTSSEWERRQLSSR